MSKTLNDLAGLLYSDRRAEIGTNLIEDGHTTTVFGTAVGSSADGNVLVHVSDDVTQIDESDGVDSEPDESTIVSVELPTAVSVVEGDKVIITLVGGTLKTPFVSAVVGEGDRVVESIDVVAEAAAAAQDSADAAALVANATNQHFWNDGSGAYVTEVTQDEWLDEDGASHQSGANTIWNSNGLFFRQSTTNLLGISLGNNPNVSIYDGVGNDAGNIVASFSASGIQLGSIASDMYLTLTDSRISFIEGDSEVAYASGGEFHAPNMTVDSALTLPTQEGSWAWIPRSNGNLALKWIG